MEKTLGHNLHFKIVRRCIDVQQVDVNKITRRNILFLFLAGQNYVVLLNLISSVLLDFVFVLYPLEYEIKRKSHNLIT